LHLQPDPAPKDVGARLRTSELTPTGNPKFDSSFEVLHFQKFS
jgi:hypothetical protein